ncbi:hypothetical protein RN001_014107 [Aquatica leii]|uniref:Major facilitator superfamily (MFS) profile domain-containing protein n=1 Tax=Aquatica leii TaxID=1421715 RepID=A0AAN7PSK0_9COLE|nr:hypothetical protein RN001_014107 [Aquatica leii]
MSASWMSPVLPLLTSDESPLQTPLSKFQESWIVAGEKLGAFIGCFLAALLSDRIGHKRTLLFATTPLSISMICAVFVKLPIVLIILRILGGLGTGIVVVVLPLYVGQIVDNDIRMRINLLYVFLKNIGSSYIYSIGPFVSYVSLSVTCGIVPVIFAVLFVFMPECKHVKLETNIVTDATTSLIKIAKKSLEEVAVISRLQEVKKIVTYRIASKESLKELVLDKANLKAILNAMVLHTISIASGGYIISSYLQKIIENSGSSISPKLSSVIFGVIKLPSVSLAAFLINKIGRKPLLIISSAGSSIALIAEGVYFYLKEQQYDITKISWIPTTVLSLYLMFTYFGIHMVPAVVTEETFTIKAKSIASFCVSAYATALSFFLFKYFKKVPCHRQVSTHALLPLSDKPILITFSVCEK